MVKSREKREFLSYLIKIKNHIKLQMMLKQYIQHGKTNIYVHSRNVAYYSFVFAKTLEKKLGYKIAVGAMFHDFFLYDWHVGERKTKVTWF